MSTGSTQQLAAKTMKHKYIYSVQHHLSKFNIRHNLLCNNIIYVNKDGDRILIRVIMGDSLYAAVPCSKCDINILHPLCNPF